MVVGVVPLHDFGAQADIEELRARRLPQHREGRVVGQVSVGFVDEEAVEDDVVATEDAEGRTARVAVVRGCVGPQFGDQLGVVTSGCGGTRHEDDGRLRGTGPFGGECREVSGVCLRARVDAG